MVKIKHRNCKNKLGYNCDYILANGVELYELDWNGEQYNTGYLRKYDCNTNCAYVPIYNFINDEIQIIGFDEKY